MTRILLAASAALCAAPALAENRIGKGDATGVFATIADSAVTAGSGDVLTGVITSLLGQGVGRFEAAQLGAWLHGFAGDIAAESLGQPSLTAGDLINYLPEAFRRTLEER